MASANATNVKVYYDSAPIEKDKVFTVAFWAKLDAAEGNKREVTLYAQTSNVSPNLFFNKDIVLDSTEWKEYIATFIAPKDVEGNIWIGFLVGISDVDFWIDDFRFFEGGPTDEIKTAETVVSPSGKLPATWGGIKALR